MEIKLKHPPRRGTRVEFLQLVGATAEALGVDVMSDKDVIFVHGARGKRLRNITSRIAKVIALVYPAVRPSVME